MSLLPLRPDLPEFLSPYLPDTNGMDQKRPSITLTYAQSLDSRISKGPGIRTTISHAETKTMTHYLRYHHDGILIGSGTVLADNPSLNCKLLGPRNIMRTPKPIIIDPSQKWRFTGSKMQEVFLNGQGKSPIVVIANEPIVKEDNVSYLLCPCIKPGVFDWQKLCDLLRSNYGIKSLMIEGGASIINQLLLRPDLVDNLIITIGSTFLGKDGVEVSPLRPTLLHDMNWWKGSTDVVLAAHIKR